MPQHAHPSAVTQAPRRARVVLGVIAAMLIGQPGMAIAESLTVALARTYAESPSIQAALAEVKSAAELLPQARSGYLPTVSVTGVEGRTITRQSVRARASGGAVDEGIDETLTDRSLELALSLNLYDGGATGAGLDAAESEVASALAQLDQTVGQTLLALTIAYADVVRLLALIDLGRDVETQLRQLETEAKSMYAKRLVTLTDVAQASASLSGAIAQRVSLESDLAAATSRYLALSGRVPDALTQWPDLPRLPETLDEARRIAETENPSLRSAKYDTASAHSRIGVAKGALRPSLDFYTSYQKTWDRSRYTGASDYKEFDREDDLAVGVQLNVPLFSGGKSYSEVRQANADYNRYRSLMAATHRETMRALEADWASLSMAQRRQHFVGEEVAALKQTLEGFLRQFKNGLSTMKDVLDARQSLDLALEQSLTADYDIFVSHASILQDMGRFTPTEFGLPVEPHGAAEYVEAVRYRLFGTDVD